MALQTTGLEFFLLECGISPRNDKIIVGGTRVGLHLLVLHLLVRILPQRMSLLLERG